MKNDQLDWREMLVGIENEINCCPEVSDKLRGEISLQMHRTFAAGILQAALHIQEKRILLSGGCFQNRLLSNLVIKSLTEKGNCT